MENVIQLKDPIFSEVVGVISIKDDDEEEDDEDEDDEEDELERTPLGLLTKIFSKGS